MTYKEAWEAIYFRHCEETCDYAYMDNCQEGKCEYYMALQALNRQYYAECGSVWTKPKADHKDEPPMDCKGCKHWKGGCDIEFPICKRDPVEDEPIIYGDEHNCIMTMFGECSYNETGCGSCAVVEKVRNALDKYEPKTEPQTNLVNDSQILVKDLVDDEFNPYDEECMRCKHLKLKCEFVPTYCRFEPIEHIEPKHGEWIYTNNTLRVCDEWKCDQCGNISFEKTNFCDRCGADMRKREDE
jgi:hypothetical protein